MVRQHKIFVLLEIQKVKGPNVGIMRLLYGYGHTTSKLHDCGHSARSVIGIRNNIQFCKEKYLGTPAPHYCVEIAAMKDPPKEANIFTGETKRRNHVHRSLDTYFNSTNEISTIEFDGVSLVIFFCTLHVIQTFFSFFHYV